MRAELAAERKGSKGPDELLEARFAVGQLRYSDAAAAAAAAATAADAEDQQFAFKLESAGRFRLKVRTAPRETTVSLLHQVSVSTDCLPCSTYPVILCSCLLVLAWARRAGRWPH